jgi:hypothetical protein
MKKTKKQKRNSKIIKWIIVLIIILYFTTGYARGINLMYDIQSQEQALQASTIDLEAMTVPELINHTAPENATTLSRVAWCESSHNPSAIHYNDGGKGKHSVGILQFQEATFLHYEKEIGEDLDYYSSYDQIKVANYMLEKGQGRQWTCYRKIYGVK